MIYFTLFLLFYSYYSYYNFQRERIDNSQETLVVSEIPHQSLKNKIIQIFIKNTCHCNINKIVFMLIDNG